MKAVESFAVMDITSGQYQRMPITRVDYDSILKARNTLELLLELEENFYTLCESYSELELTIHQLSLQHLIYGVKTSEQFGFNRLLLSRRLAAFLSSVKLYKDAAPSICSRSSNKTFDAKQANSVFSKSFDASIDYRVFEALRNYSQHKALPVHSVSFSSELSKDRTQTIHSTELYLMLNILGQNGDFKSKILDELKQRAIDSNTWKKTFDVYPRYDLKSGARRYFFELGKCHLEIRNGVREFGTKAEETLSRFSKQWETVTESDPLAWRVLIATNTPSENHPEPEDRVYLRNDGDKLRSTLTLQNAARQNDRENIVRF